MCYKQQDRCEGCITLNSDDKSARLILSELSRESSWVEIGRAAAELEEAEPVDSRGVPWTEFILNRLERLGRRIAAQQLRKIRRCYSFLLREANVDPDDYSTCPLAGIEVISKIYAIDRDEAHRQLDALRGGLPYMEVLQRYEGLRGSSKGKQAKPSAVARLLSKERAQVIETSLISWVEDLPDVFFGNEFRHFFSVKPPTAQFQSVDLAFRYTLHGSKGHPLHLGIEIRSMLSFSYRSISNLVAQVNLAASFYDRFWIVLAGVEEDKSVSAALEKLRVFNVGVATIDLEGRREIYATPSGPPVPDRRDLLRIR